MLLTPTNAIKRRLALQWSKIQTNNRWQYSVAERSVINNKPHITVTASQIQHQPMQHMPFMSLGNFLQLPNEVEEEYEDDDS